MKTRKLNLLGTCIAFALGGLSTPVMANGSDMVNPQSGVVIGYWHNWCGGAGYKGGVAPCVALADINPQYNVVDVSFMKVYGAVGSIPTFKLDAEIGLSEAQFIDQISEINRQGRSVLLALGGADAHIELRNGQEQALADEIIRLVEVYGFDGLDIDLEQAAITAADNQIVIPAALRIVKDHYREQGKNFLVTMAPEFPYLTASGKYVPYITALEGYYDWISPQFYNQGGDGVYIEGLGWIAQNNDNLKQEFIYHIANALVNGTNSFTKIPHDKLVFGIPTNIDAAATGYVKEPQKLYGAFEQLKAQGQPLRGVMTWSINWDMGKNSAGQDYGESFIKSYGPFIHGQDIPPPKPDNSKPTFAGLTHARVKFGDQFDPLSGISAYDMEDKDLTSAIEVDGVVDTQTLGLYALTYRVTDSDDNLTEQVRSVEVYNTNPEIKGATNASILLGSVFNSLAGVSAMDAEDGELTDRLIVEGSVDTNTVGKYVLTYRVNDNAGEQVEVLRTITVKEQSTVCENEWHSTVVYLGGETVNYAGKVWLAGWWTKGDEPGAAGRWGVWKIQGESDCEGDLPPEAKPALNVSGIAPRYALEQGNVTIEFSANVNQTMMINASLVQGGTVFASTKVNVANSAIITLSATGLTPGSYEAVVSSSEQELTRRISVNLVEEDSEGSRYPAYVAGTQYQAGDVVTNRGSVFECLPWPNSGWCSGSASHYAPGTGSSWKDAWFAR